MPRCLISLSESTVAFIVSLRSQPDESLDSVVYRALDKLASVPSKDVPTSAAQIVVPRREAGREATQSVTLFGDKMPVRTKKDALAAVLDALSRRDAGFRRRFSFEQGRTRRFVARSREALYPGSPHLAKYARDIGHGWWMATNFSERDIARAARKACAAAR